MEDTNTLLVENYIDKKTLSDFVGVSIRYIDLLMSRDGLPYYKIGRSVRFKVSEVVAWLQQRRMP